MTKRDHLCKVFRMEHSTKNYCYGSSFANKEMSEESSLASMQK